MNQRFGNRAGAAIVTALLILLAIAVVGGAAALLAQTNLAVTINVGSNAIAQANAESGLDGMMAVLERRHQDDGVFPLAEPAPATVRGLRYQATYDVIGYERLAPNAAVVRVAGRGPNVAEHVSEAVVNMLLGEPGWPEAWDFGLASESVCRTTGISEFINAGIHCNDGFSLGRNDRYGVCETRDANGICVTWTSIPIENAPVSASPGATTCSPAALCESGVPRTLVEPIVIQPDYVVRRNRAIAAASQVDAEEVPFPGTTYSSVFGIYCDIVTSSVADLDLAAGTGQTICLESSAQISIPEGQVIEGVTLITQGNVELGAGVQLLDSTLVSTGGWVQSASQGNASATIIDSAIFSEAFIRLNGQQTEIEGSTTLASNGHVTVNGSAPATTSPDGTPSIGLVIVATGDITINGNADWFVAVIGGGTFTQNGTGTLHGRVASRGAIQFNGGVDLDAGLPVGNDDGMDPPRGRLQVASRR